MKKRVLVVSLFLLITSASCETYPLFTYKISSNGKFKKEYKLEYKENQFDLKLGSILTTEHVGGAHITEVTLEINNKNSFPIYFLTDSVRLKSKYYTYSEQRFVHQNNSFFNYELEKQIIIPSKEVYKIEANFIDSSNNVYEKDIDKLMRDQVLELYLQGIVVKNDTVSLPELKFVPNVAIDKKS